VNDAMPSVSIYHNPRCSKSRQTLMLLEERGITPEIIKYLDTPPSAQALVDVVKALGIKPWDLLRRNEAAFKDLQLAADAADEDVITAMLEHPILIERPIVIRGHRAVIGRPPEAVLSLFD
jgi:arsenate reductase